MGENAMIEFDDSRWPLVTVSFHGQFTVADATGYVIAFDNILRRREPFAIAMVYADDTTPAVDRDEGTGSILARWLKANRTLLMEWCRGMASVVPGAAARDAMAPRIANGERVFGCPVALFGAIDEAERWLSERLRPVAPPAESAATATATATAHGAG